MTYSFLLVLRIFFQQMKEFLNNEEGLQNKILSIYHEYAPDKLSTIILDSILSNYNPQKALEFLSNSQKSKKNQTPQESDKDTLAHAFLYIKCKIVENATKSLESLDPMFLADYCLSHLGWFIQNDIGRYMRLCLPWLLLEILTQMSGLVSLDTAISLMETQKNQDYSDLSDR